MDNNKLDQYRETIRILNGFVDSKGKFICNLQISSMLSALLDNPEFILLSGEITVSFTDVQDIVNTIYDKRYNLNEDMLENSLYEKLLRLLYLLKGFDQFVDVYRYHFEKEQNNYNINTAYSLQKIKESVSTTNDSLSHITKSIECIENKYSELSSKILEIISDFESFKNIDISKSLLEAKASVLEIKKLQKNAEQIIGDIAENKNAGKYNEYYKKCRKSARGLFWFSLLIMVFVAVFVGWHLWNIETLESAKLLIRMPMALLVLLPSFFMMREAKKLKDKEFQYHDMMCRIVTSAPYIDGLTHLDDNQKDQMKADLVKDFFARPIECRDDGGLVPIEEICKIVKTCAGEK